MFLKLFLAFLKVGTLGFGSGPAMLVLIEREMRDLGIMTTAEFSDAIALSTALPGPLATKMALYCGYSAGGVPGAMASLLGMLIPSSVAVLLLARFLVQFKDQPKVAAVLKAMQPVVVAIFLYLAVNMSRSLRFQWDIVLLGVLAFVALMFKVEPAWVVLGAISVGLIFY